MFLIFWRLLTHYSPPGDRTDRIICITAISAWPGYESFWQSPVWHHSRCPPVLPLAMESQGGRTWLIFMWYAWMVKDGRLNLVIPLWGGKCTGWFPSTSQSREVQDSLCHTLIHLWYFNKRWSSRELWAATLSCTYVPKTLNAAWCYLQGIPVCDEEHTLEGVAKIQLATAAILPNLNNPPTSLTNLTFGDMFNQSLQGVILPSSLQSLTFGETFNQSLQGVTLPSSLQSLTFGHTIRRSLQKVVLSRSFQSLIYVNDFNQSLQGVTLFN